MSAQVHNFSFGDFVWWIGVVEDRDDPKKIGRVRVRIFGYHPEDKGQMPTESLPWAIAEQPTDSAALSGVGSSPVGMQVGTTVRGYFADGKNAQVPIVSATLPGFTNGKADTNELTRGEDLENTVIQKKKNSVLTSSPLGQSRDALSLNNTANQLTQQIGNLGIDLRGITNAIKIPAGITSIQGFSDVRDVAGTLRRQIFQIESQIAQVRALGQSVEAFNAKKSLARSISSYKYQIEGLKNVLGGNQLADLEAAIRGIDNIKNAADSLQKVDSALSSVTQIAGAVSNLKSLASSIGGGGAVKGVIDSLMGGSLSNIWSEAVTQAAPEYPLNRILMTEGGILEEVDSTPGAERIHRYHPTGTFNEVHPDGTVVDKVVKDKYSIVMGDDKVHIDGNVQVNIVGASNVVINGDSVIHTNGNSTNTVTGDYTLAIGGDYSLVVGGSHKQTAAVQTLILAPRIDLNQ